MNLAWPLFTFLLTFHAISKRLSDKRDALLACATVFMLVLFAVTEILSVVHLFCYDALWPTWMLAAFIALVLNFGLVTSVADDDRRHPRWSKPDALTTASLSGTGLVVLLVGLTALRLPPNNWDAMTYHMPRVCHWVENRSIAYYPTHILRQLYMGTLAEFAIAHAQIFIGSDRLANSIQLCAMAGTIVGASSLAAKLGATARGQALAALFTATIPMMILQGSNVQTDAAVSFWLVTVANFSWTLVSQPKRTQLLIELLTSVALGLALLTKATAFCFLCPWAALVCLQAILHRQIKKFVRLTVLFVLIPGAINASHLSRNQATFGNFLAPNSEKRWYSNEIHTPDAIFSNALRNLFSDLGFPGMGRLQTAAVVAVEKLSMLDASDPRITFPGRHFRVRFSRSDDDAGNLIHLLIALASIGYFFLSAKGSNYARIYAVAVICSFLIFCSVVKWQPWITRLQLPLFALAAPLSALMMDKFARPFMIWLVAGVLFLQSFFYTSLRSNPALLMHSLTANSRLNHYFDARPDLWTQYQTVAAAITLRRVRRIGIVGGGDSWEYGLLSQLPLGTKFDEVGVDNQSAKSRSEQSDRVADYVVELDDAPLPGGRSHYIALCKQPKISLFQRIDKVSTEP